MDAVPYVDLPPVGGRRRSRSGGGRERPSPPRQGPEDIARRELREENRRGDRFGLSGRRGAHRARGDGRAFAVVGGGRNGADDRRGIIRGRDSFQQVLAGSNVVRGLSRTSGDHVRGERVHHLRRGASLCRRRRRARARAARGTVRRVSRRGGHTVQAHENEGQARLSRQGGGQRGRGRGRRRALLRPSAPVPAQHGRVPRDDGEVAPSRGGTHGRGRRHVGAPLRPARSAGGIVRPSSRRRRRRRTGRSVHDGRSGGGGDAAVPAQDGAGSGRVRGERMGDEPGLDSRADPVSGGQEGHGGVRDQGIEVAGIERGAGAGRERVQTQRRRGGHEAVIFCVCFWFRIVRWNVPLGRCFLQLEIETASTCLIGWLSFDGSFSY
mmetsp:Transcript_36354/g.109088  ORF Transcript_36354/g.109088 Transcript_36354/m.109088 type:complete len:381 (-) Transcript_36354:171-1313(-)